MSLFSRFFGEKTAQQNTVSLKNNYGSITLINSVDGASVPIELRIPWQPVAALTNPSPSQLLTWHGRLTPLIGREPELAALQRWVDSPANVSVWILAGEGGIGKTRLAAEFAETLITKKWSAGFVDLAQFNDAASLTIDKRTLLLVDYPEERRDQLDRLFDLLKRHTGPQKLRVALLTRSAPDIKKRLAERSATHLEYNEPWSFVAGSVRPYALFRAAFEAVRSDRPAKLPDEAAFNAWLERSPLHSSALFIVAAALIARNQRAAQLELVGYDVLAQIARDEMAKIKRAAGGDAQAANAAVDAVALATAFDGVTLATLRGLTNATELGFAATALRQTLLSTQHATEPTASVCNVLRLEPDLYAAAFLNEWHLIRWHSETNDCFNGAFAELWAAAVVVNALKQWNRLAYDSTFRLGQLPNWLDNRLSEAAERGGVLTSAFSITLAQGSWFGLPRATVIVGKRMLKNTYSSSETALAVRSSQLNNASVHMIQSGDRDGALRMIREAVAICRRLTRTNRSAHASALAGSLCNLANCLNNTGDRNGALDAAREAVEIQRRLARIKPSEHQRPLANSVNNLANFLSEAGDLSGALDAAREGVEIWRRVVTADPCLQQQGLAMGVSNLANLLIQAGDGNSALAAALEGVEIRRRLAQSNSSLYEPDLALGVGNLASIFYDTGDRKGALETALEAVEIYRRLAFANLSAYEPELARSLYVLATTLAINGKKALAYEAVTETVTRLRSWAQLFPQVYSDLLQTSERLAANCRGPEPDN